MKTLPSNINGYATTQRLGNAVSFSDGLWVIWMELDT